jgi:hypothetical protein
MADTGKYVGRVRLNAHPATAAKALLPAPQFTSEKFAIHRNSGGKAAEHGHQSFSVAFTGCRKLKHLAP